MTFSDAQVRLLASKLEAKHIRVRESQGKELSYIEGWHSIAEANRIFGFDGWDRETLHVECIWQQGGREPRSCAYMARVRIRVRAGDTVVSRDGTGFGQGTGANLGEAQEKAVKEAETDATKRALSTFGNIFGLALYDKDQKGVRRPRSLALRSAPEAAFAAKDAPMAWSLMSATGAVVAEYQSPRDFCAGLRQSLEEAVDQKSLEELWRLNDGHLSELRRYRPELRTSRGAHYVDLLERVFDKQFQRLSVPAPRPISAGREPDVAPGSDAGVAGSRRIRDTGHLARVGARPCLVCGRAPSHAHHLMFAQPRAMGSKVSDEWTVPLCYLHHRALHDHGAEERWWQERDIDPLAEAQRLWQETRRGAAPTDALEAPAPAQEAEPAGAAAGD